MIRKLILAAAFLAPLAATAKELPTAPYLPLDLAVKAADAALQACVAEGRNSSILTHEINPGPFVRAAAEGHSEENGWDR